jgi:cytochrome c peroxidase
MMASLRQDGSDTRRSVSAGYLSETLRLKMPLAGQWLPLLFSIALFAANPSIAATEPYLALMTPNSQYHLTLIPVTSPVPLRTPHAWRLHVATKEGQTFLPRQLVVNGGMPGHAHGFPSKPSVTRLIDDGVFLVEGITFNMPGRWLFKVAVVGPQGSDTGEVAFQVDAQGVISTGGSGSVTTLERSALLASFSIELLGKPRDPSNRWLGNDSVASFGRDLFFDRRLSENGKISCASCHQPARHFTDGLARARGIAETQRNTPDLIGVAHRTWFYWDGRRDSLWSQALIPFEAAAEMGTTRVALLHRIGEFYADAYEALFGALPDLTDVPVMASPLGTASQRKAWRAVDKDVRDEISAAFANIGKAIAAYEAQIEIKPSRFDQYVSAVMTGDANNKKLMSADELAGLNLFLDMERTRCLRCHNGPLFSNQGFHNVGTGNTTGAFLDFGRVLGLQAAMMTEFNCMGSFSDAGPEDCAHLRYAQSSNVPESMTGAFKVPGLRNLGSTAPYMHDGRYSTIMEVLEHYRSPPAQAIAIGEIAPLDLNDLEMRQLELFLRTLDGI